MTLKRMSLLAILAIVPALAAAPAAATATLSCTIDDANLTFSLEAPMNREFGTIFQSRGEIRLKAKQVQKMGPALKLEHEHLAQHWVYERELRIGINVENDEGSLFLWIVAQGDKTGERYSGRYVMRVSVSGSDSREFKGRIKGCSAGD